MKTVSSREYGEKFKARAVARMTGEGRRSAHALSKELGVPQPTLSRWLRGARNVVVVGDESEKKPERRPEDWSPNEKLEAVLEAAGLGEEELGRWLRVRGLTEAHLQRWREALEDRASEVFSPSKSSGSGKASRKREKELERELRRKEKALAETAALLVLRGKLQALWADEDASTRHSSDEPSSKRSTKRGKRERE
jgi:transposase-like protein